MINNIDLKFLYLNYSILALNLQLKIAEKMPIFLISVNIQVKKLRQIQRDNYNVTLKRKIPGQRTLQIKMLENGFLYQLYEDLLEFFKFPPDTDDVYSILTMKHLKWPFVFILLLYIAAMAIFLAEVFLHNWRRDRRKH